MKRTSILFIFFIILMQNAGAAESGLQLSLHIGFNGVFQSDGLVPVKVFVRNEGNDIEGTLMIDTASVKPGRERENAVYSQDITLPRNSYKSFSFILPADQMDEINYSVTDSSGNTVLEKKISPSAVKGLDNLVLVLSKSVSFDFLSRPGEGRLNRIIYAHPDILPDSWFGYSQVSAVVLHNIPGSDLSEHQLKALGKWISNGGTFIVVGGTHLDRNSFSAFENILPVRPGGSGRDLIKAGAAAFGDSLAGEEIACMNVIWKRGDILAGTKTLPLVVSAGYGAGRVVFSGVDFTREPLKSWNGRNRFWADLLPVRRPTEPAQIMEKDFNNKLLVNSIEDGTKNGKITAYFFMIVIPFLLCLVVLHLSRKKGVIPVVLFLLLLSGISLFVYQTYRQPTPALARRISILQMKDNSGFGKAEHHLLLGAARESDYSLHIAENDMYAVMNNNQGIVKQSSSSISIENIHIPGWHYFTYLFYSAEEFKYAADLSDFGTGKRFELENKDTSVIKAAFFIYKGHIYPAGDLAPGDKVSRVFYGIDSVNSTRPADGWKNSFRDDPDSFSKIEIMKAVFGYNRFDYLLSSSTITFAGWIDTGVPEIITSVPFNAEKNFTLLFIPLDTGGKS